MSSALVCDEFSMVPADAGIRSAATSWEPFSDQDMERPAAVAEASGLPAET
jgi:hypothetical protein